MNVREQIAAARAAVEDMERAGVQVIRVDCAGDRCEPTLICLQRTIDDLGWTECEGCRIVWQRPVERAEPVRLERSAPSAAAATACRHCGCTDVAACVHADGTPCWWISPGLCSLCAERVGVDVDTHRTGAACRAVAP